MHSVIRTMDERMRKSIDSFKLEIAKLRTGRAHPSILDHVRIDYYGTETPLSQVANITVSDARTLVISPWEKRTVPLIEKAILNSDLGLNPATSGEVIRVPMPALTEDRRRELIKVVRNEAEAARVGIRNVRRDANAALKELLKQKSITEDEERRLTENVQKQTDKCIQEVEQLLTAKEADLLAV
ncbi:MAG: ribosome recycling factor [Gammaproteobacteria bacterium RIFCSPHIGHO2_12_FULL_41_20]|nr:MAG: ribosome recycling factor [Gammaproteobacteria bacterium RIFCSPHIGHO2_12_FULL_41_20]